jgi:hypothetical protein
MPVCRVSVKSEPDLEACPPFDEEKTSSDLIWKIEVGLEAGVVKLQEQKRYLEY